MRVPLSWLREYAPIPDPVDAAEVARRLTAAGLEVESHEPVGDIRDVVTAQVVTIEELTEFKKPIRYCRVATSAEDLARDPAALRGVICGATNFAAGDKVALALPGSVLPGGFEIAARKTYGHVSEGMICAADELAVGEDHSGIIVLPPDTPLGVDFIGLAGLRDEVFEIAITPDRGYAVSIRGIARELASAYNVPFTDPAAQVAAAVTGILPGSLDDIGANVYPASIADPTACDRFVLREVRGFDPAAATPLWMWARLARCEVRSISLAVDVTNYLMLELGQPLHAFDRSKLSGPIVVRRAVAGETLETLDHVTRTLLPDDILITDSSGPISMAGTMGGLSTEIDERSADVVIEGAHFSDIGTAKMSRRHKLHSEASYRFERGVDRELPLVATARAAALLASLGGGSIVPGCTHAQVAVAPVVISMAADYPDRVAGVPYGLEIVVRRLEEVGCTVTQAHLPAEPTVAPWRSGGHAGAPGEHHGKHDRQVLALQVTPPSWRADLTDPADLAEEVIRLEGYEDVPVRTPRAVAGRGLTQRQRLLRSASRTLAEAGFVEVNVEPFARARDADSLGLAAEDERRLTVRIANPLSEDEPLLRTTLLPGLFRTLARNVGRGFTDVALFESDLVFRLRPGAPGAAPILATDRGPTPEELLSVDAALPDQPLHIGGVLAGNRELPGWWGPGRAAGWADAIEAARSVAHAGHLAVEVQAAREAPWHPGRCAALFVTAAHPARHAAGEPQRWLLGHAGELHPRVIAAYGLPARTCAFELSFSVLAAAAEGAPAVSGPKLSAYPLATQDVALVVRSAVAAASVEAALIAGAGDLLEDVRLFDVYTGSQLQEGQKSLAYTLRFRAPDRTLTAAETTMARDGAIAEAARRVGAVQRA
jgi:phenylalanyl-tRNA synthetase beta chain